jgi:hypothetical protein
MKLTKAMASGGVQLAKKNKIIILCALAVVVAMLMATQAAPTQATEAQHADSTASCCVIISS